LAKNREPVLVIGLGRFGQSIIEELLHTGTEVLALDRDISLVQRASTHVPNVVAADATDEEAMRQAGATNFRRVVIAIGSDQEASILATSVCVDLGISDIWAKAQNPQHARILERIGAHHVVQPEHDMGERIAHLLGGRLTEYIEVAPDWVLARTNVSKYFVGMTLKTSNIRAKHGVTVVGIRKAGTSGFTHADGYTTLEAGDEILLMGPPEAIEAFSEA
jgi:trk system potassium uptake protein TrkA